MYDVLRCMPTVPGAVGAFRRRAIAGVGGVPTDTLAEDTDLTMALLRAGWEVVYAEDARAWTEAPASLRPMFAPVVDVAAIYALALQPLVGLAAWLAFLLLQLVPALVEFRWDRERP